MEAYFGSSLSKEFGCPLSAIVRDWRARRPVGLMELAPSMAPLVAAVAEQLGCDGPYPIVVSGLHAGLATSRSGGVAMAVAAATGARTCFIGDSSPSLSNAQGPDVVGVRGGDGKRLDAHILTNRERRLPTRSVRGIDHETLAARIRVSLGSSWSDGVAEQVDRLVQLWTFRTTFVEQAGIVNARIQLRNYGTNSVWLDNDTLALRVFRADGGCATIMNELLSMICEPRITASLQRYGIGENRRNATGTFLFWHYDAIGRRRALRLSGDTLVTDDLNFRIQLSLEDIRGAIISRSIGISSAVKYALIMLVAGGLMLGGRRQQAGCMCLREFVWAETGYRLGTLPILVPTRTLDALPTLQALELPLAFDRGPGRHLISTTLLTPYANWISLV